MPLPAIEKRWCLGDLAVPLVRVQDEDEGEIFELDVTSREGCARFLETSLGLKYRSFRSREWPFLEAILSHLKELRGKKCPRATVRTSLLLLFEIRGIEVLVRNNIKRLTICFREESLASSLAAFLSELQKDAGGPPEPPAAASAEGSAVGAAPGLVEDETLPPEEEKGQEGGSEGEDTCGGGPDLETLERNCIRKHLQTVGQHPNCASVHWGQARRCFLIKRKSKEGLQERLEVRVPGLKRRRQAAHQGGDLKLRDLEDAFKRAAEDILRVLEPAEASSGVEPAETEG
jgi:hypothetical protein